MATINLRDYYPYYTADCFIEVSDEVAAMLLAHARYEAAYQRRRYWNKAHYSSTEAMVLSMMHCSSLYPPSKYMNARLHMNSFMLLLPVCRTSRPNASMPITFLV